MPKEKLIVKKQNLHRSAGEKMILRYLNQLLSW